VGGGNTGFKAACFTHVAVYCGRNPYALSVGDESKLVVVAIRQIYDAKLRSRRKSLLNDAAGGQSLVVFMRGKDEDSVLSSDGRKRRDFARLGTIGRYDVAMCTPGHKQEN
jgi:hypothetical protein